MIIRASGSPDGPSARSDPLAGRYGEAYARLRVALEVDCRAIETVPALFVPLLATLLFGLNYFALVCAHSPA